MQLFHAIHDHSPLLTVLGHNTEIYLTIAFYLMGLRTVDWCEASLDVNLVLVWAEP